MENSIENNKTLEILNNNNEIMNHRGIIASYLSSLLSKNTNLDSTSLFELVKDPHSNRVNDLLINKTLPVTLLNNGITFCDTDKKIRNTRRCFDKDN